MSSTFIRPSSHVGPDRNRDHVVHGRWNGAGGAFPHGISAIHAGHGKVVELRGIEPLTSAVRLQRSPI
jgi:hypothetical protein